MITEIQMLNSKIWYSNYKIKIKDYHFDYYNRENGITNTYDISIYYSDTNNKDEFIVKDFEEETSFDTFNSAKIYAFKRIKHIYDLNFNHEIELVNLKNNKKYLWKIEHEKRSKKNENN